MIKQRVSAVSYTNTKPFVYGLTHSPIMEYMEMSLDIPATCAQKLSLDQVDVGLVPTAEILKLKDVNIFTHYGIGATGAVNSVFLFSNIPVEKVKTIRLDSHSRTSNLLCKVLMKRYWQNDVEFLSWDSNQTTDAFVLIGDRTFDQINQHPYQYDLSEEWFNYSKLPFVFATWIANKSLKKEFINLFTAALQHGLQSIDQVIAEEQSKTIYKGFDLEDYLKNKLEFNLSSAHFEGMERFLTLAKEF